MKKSTLKKLTLPLFATLLFSTTTSHADNEALTTKMTEAQDQLKRLQDSNIDLKKKLANSEDEITNWQLALEKLEADVTEIKKQVSDEEL